MCKATPPAEVVRLLNTMFAAFDVLLQKHTGVYKVGRTCVGAGAGGR
jgi:hypothetical protein